MAAIIDTIIILWVIFIGISGWKKGILRTLVGPLSLIIGTLASIAYFHKTYHMMGLLLGVIAGPVVLALILSFAIVIWHKKVSNSLPPSWPSRMLGCIFNLTWAVCLIIPAFMAIAIMPANIPYLKNLQESIIPSRTYSLIERFAKGKIPLINDTETVFQVAQNPDKLRNMESTPEFAVLYRDKKIQDILSDKEISRQIENKELMKLLENPKILALWKDKELMKKLTNLQASIIKRESGLKSSPGPTKEVKNSSATGNP